MVREDKAQRIYEQVEVWEVALIGRVAAVFRTHDLEELKAELARTLIEFRTEAPQRIRKRRAYVAKVLYNKAANWIRVRRAVEKQTVSLTKEDKSGNSSEEEQRFIEVDLLERIALAHVWHHLDPQMRAFWQILLEKNGNQAATARELRIHRNTVQNWIKEIRRVLKAHEF